MGIQAGKTGVRALGISESFVKGADQRSILAGVVMRGDLKIDGFSFNYTTVGGMDSTESILGLYYKLERNDINLLMLNGCIISWFNVVDLKELNKETGKPVICITYEESEGIDQYFKEYFEDWETRLEVYRRNGERTKTILHTGHQIFTRFIGIKEDLGRRTLDRFTLEGGVPEPLRISRILARAILKSELSTRHNR
ncbi:MAG: DUF99 family protein [Candidatus Bathyarchaeota archaeon]|nr:MAG: DUF99 family protein [Candidatus Bathyarchaeota archaeon]